MPILKMIKKSPKTIIFLIDWYDIGGVTTYTKNQVELLSKKGIKIIIIGCEGNIENPDLFFEKSEVHVVYKTLKESKKNSIAMLSTAIEYKNKVNFLLSQNTENTVLHFSTIRSLIYTHLNSIAWRYPSVITFHGAQHLEITHLRKNIPLNQRVKIYLFRQIQLYFLKKINRIVILSEYSKKLISQHFNDKLVNKTILIPGFLDTKVSEISKKPNKKLIIVNIGRAEPRKGVNVLLKSLSILKNFGIPFKCYIASPIIYHYWFFQYLDMYENERLFTAVHFLHGLNQEEKELLLKSADVFVLPSRDYETFGYTTLEAISRGIPVIGSDSGATPEILNHIDTNLIFESNSEISLANTFKWFYSLNIEQRKKLSKKCTSTYRNHFHSSKYLKKVLSVYS